MILLDHEPTNDIIDQDSWNLMIFVHRFATFFYISASFKDTISTLQTIDV